MPEPDEKKCSLRKSYLLTSPTIPSPLLTCHRSLRLLKRPLEEAGRGAIDDSIPDSVPNRLRNPQFL